MASRVRRLRLRVDERTAEMGAEALGCRAFGHLWRRLPQSPDRRNQLLRLGQVETRRVCGNGCGVSWVQVFDATTFETLETKHEYEDRTYLVPSGQGRLPKAEARKACFARENPDVA